MSEDEESQVCAKCHEHYSMDAPDMEPTKFCDDCAHDVAEEATAECEKLKAELEHVQKQAAVMRSCLEHIKTLALECREDPKIVLSAVGLSAIGGLQSEISISWVSKENVKPIAQVIEYVFEWCCDENGDEIDADKVRAALHACEKLGLLEDK